MFRRSSSFKHVVDLKRNRAVKVKAFSTSVFFRSSSVFLLLGDNGILKGHDLVVGAELAAVNEHGLQFLGVEEPVGQKQQGRIGLSKFFWAGNTKMPRVGQFAVLTVKVEHDQIG